MTRDILILIADRNPHVREFLKRELSSEGYRIRLADKGRDVLGWVAGREAVDLLIIDPDLPDIEGGELLGRLHGRQPVLPVIVHTYRDALAPGCIGPDAFVEKSGNSVEALKRAIADIVGGEAASGRTNR